MVVQRENGIFGWRFLCNFLFIKMRGGRKVENCILIQRTTKEREKERCKEKEKGTNHNES